MSLYTLNDFTGWLNLTLSSNIPDNSLTIAKNMYYNRDKQLETRRGIKKFWTTTGTSPFTSLFFFKRDDNLNRYLVGNYSDKFSVFNELSSTWSSVKTGLSEFETIPAISSQRTRWNYSVYKNVIYMANGVDPYAKYDLSTYTSIWLWTATACTCDNATDKITAAAHWLNNGDEVMFAGTMPTWLTAWRVYYVINKTTNDFQIAVTRDWVAIDFATNGSGVTFQKLTQPRVRYLQYLSDRMFWAWDDWNPITLYYTAAAPTNADTLNTNLVVVWGDENGRINWLNEQGAVVLTFKDKKIYAVDLTNNSALPIDAQTWGNGDRTIHAVGNSLLYFNSERWIDKLQVRYATAGGQALESKPLSDNIRRLTQLISEQQYNAATAMYARPYNNYYFSFDTNGDNIPDTHLVYSSLTWAWTEYTLPSLYDYCIYEDSDANDRYLLAPSSTWQIYEFETWYDDDWIPIQYEIETKRIDFKEPSQFKTYQFVDVVGWKTEGTVIDIKAKVNGIVESAESITDANIDKDDSNYKMLWVSPIWIDTLGAWEWEDWLGLYRYIARLPMYSMGNDISINMSSTGWQRIIEKMMISSEKETIDIFNYWNIL